MPCGGFFIIFHTEMKKVLVGRVGSKILFTLWESMDIGGTTPWMLYHPPPINFHMIDFTPHQSASTWHHSLPINFHITSQSSSHDNQYYHSDEQLQGHNHEVNKMRHIWSFVEPAINIGYIISPLYVTIWSQKPLLGFFRNLYEVLGRW